MGRQNYRKLVVKLDIQHNLGLQKAEFQEIMKRLDLVTADLSEDEVLAVMNKLKNDVRKDPLKDQIKKNQVKATLLPGVCPVCGTPGEPVELQKGRKAFYCAVHRNTTPAVKNTEE
jgi:hypothetical protein